MEDKGRYEFTFYPAENNDEDNYVCLTFEHKGAYTVETFFEMCVKFGVALGFSEQSLNDQFKE